MENIKNVQDSNYYGFGVIVILFVLLIFQLATLGVAAGFEGFSHNNYYHALGGPPGASGSLSDHTGWGGDQVWHHIAGNENFHSPNRNYRDGFLGGRFPGPLFTENAAAMAASRVAPLYRSVKDLRRDIDILSQAPPPAEVALGNGGPGSSNVVWPTMTSNTASVLNSEEGLDDAHSEDRFFNKLQMGL